MVSTLKVGFGIGIGGKSPSIFAQSKNICIYIYKHAKNHGISKQVGTGDPRTLLKTHPNPSFWEGPMILRVYISGQIIIIRRSLGRISYFQMEISLGR